MELLEGGSARSLMDAAGGRLSEKRALQIIQQAAAGLDAAHNAGMLHRDIKPENIMLTATGVAKLTDLGLAHITEMEGGSFWGSPGYVAPEVITGAAENDPRTDVYSLGASLFELLVGSPPFLAETPEDILRLQINEEPLDIGQLHPELHPRTIALVRLMLAKDPLQRARSADIVVNAIGRILTELVSGGTTRHTPVQPARVVPARPKSPTPLRRPVLKRPIPGRPVRRPLPSNRPAVQARPQAPGSKMFDIGAPPPPKAPRPAARPIVNRPGIRPPRRPL